MKPYAHRTVTIAFACILLAAGACSKKSDESSAKPPDNNTKPTTAKPQGDKVLNVYSGRTAKLVSGVIAEFEKASGIKVKVKYADTAQLAATLLEEGKRSPADVFLAQDASHLGLLEAKGLFAKLPDAALGKVERSFKSANGAWIGVTGRARVLAYNTKKLKPEDLPASAAELTDPKWKGRVGWAPENASFQSAVSAMIQLEGKEAAEAWIKGLQANNPHAYPKNTPAVEAVGRGEIDVALVNHYYLYRLKKELGDNFSVANHYFGSGKADSLVNVSGVAILATSKNRDAAQKFVEFLVSEPAQTYFTSKNYEFPLVSGIKTPHGLPDIATLKAPVVDLAKLQDLKTTHELLRAAKALP